MKRFFKVLLAMIILALGINMAAASAAEGSSGAVSVPLRMICEAEGAVLTWDKDLITVQKGDNKLTIKVKSNEAAVNGKTLIPDSRIQVVNNRVKVPLSLINEAFGLKLTEEDCAGIISASYFDLLLKGATSDCMMLYGQNLKNKMPSALAGQIGTGLKAFGDLKLAGTAVNRNSVHLNAILTYTSPKVGQIDYIVRFDDKLQIDDFFLNMIPVMPYKTPDYDKSDNYTEQQVVFGEGEFRLPGILTVPKGEGPFPVVVLVHGSGANDMDETMGPLKPFKDLTSGLVSRNIAVLRYSKRTYEHNWKSAMIPNFTAKEETIDDAVAAVNFLGTVKGIDPSRIFVIGHSQGSMLVPAIIKADKAGRIKGAAMMSGNARPLQDVMIEQYEYFYKLGQLTKEQRDFYVNQLNMINDPGFSADNPPKGYMLGNINWWVDLKTYNQTETAKDITKPLLIMHGSRDYQVSAAKDFQGWKDALSGKSNVSFRLYPKLNHMYTEGDGEMSTNLEYFKPANIPSYVIDDINQWIESAK